MVEERNRGWGVAAFCGLALLAAGWFLASCNSGISREDGPNLVVETLKIESGGNVYIDFDIVPPGWEPNTQTVTIKNTGTRDLVISQFEWEGQRNTSVTMCQNEANPVDCLSRTLPITLPTDTSIQVKVRYAPQLAEDLQDKRETTLLIGSNDTDFPVLRLIYRVPQSFPQITVDRSSLSFPGATPSSPKSETVTVSNEGSRDLFIRDFKIQATGTSANKFKILTDTASTTCQANLTLGSGKSCTISVEYAPVDGGPDSGTLVIESNDPNNAALGVTLGSSAQEPRIQVSTEDGTPYITLSSIGQTKSFTIRNSGIGVLTINNISITPSTESGNYSISGFVTGQKQVVKSGESLQFSVTLNTSSATPASISIDSSDLSQSPYVIQLFSNTPQSDLQIVPNGSLTFYVKNGGSQVRTLVLENRGDAIGNVQSVFIANSQGARFSPDQLSATTGVPAGGVLAMPVTFNAVNIADNSLFPITLTGQVTLQLGGNITQNIVLFAVVDSDDNKKPVANLGSPSNYNGFTTCDQVTIDGSGSQAKEGTLVQYEWKILAKPATSRVFLSHTGKDKAFLSPDIAGTYKIGLAVLDTENRTSDEVTVDIVIGQGTNCN
ncbi:MAG: choice-of-anchor D domain-containing protein [Myxococcales bacterium]|nr:choice-of-anchor D domain-containing protein [Myxococcales bacterium]